MELSLNYRKGLQDIHDPKEKKKKKKRLKSFETDILEIKSKLKQFGVWIKANDC